MNCELTAEPMETSGADPTLAGANGVIARILSQSTDAHLVLMNRQAVPTDGAVQLLFDGLADEGAGIVAPTTRQGGEGEEVVTELAAGFSVRHIDTYALGLSGTMLTQIGLFDSGLGRFAGLDLQLRALWAGWSVKKESGSVWNYENDDRPDDSARLLFERRWRPEQYQQLDNELFIDQERPPWSP